MGRIALTQLTSLDGVMQSPDPTVVPFKYRDWIMDFEFGPEGDRFKLERRRTPRPSCSGPRTARSSSLDVLTVRGGSSSEAPVFRTPEIFADFGLLPSLQRQSLDA